MKQVVLRAGGVVAILGCALVIVTVGVAAVTAEASSDSYLIISSHTPEKCLADLDAVLAEKPELLDKFEWGCMSGDHTGYLIVKADSESAAREMLPASMRKDARIVKLNKFSAEQIRSYHAKS